MDLIKYKKHTQLRYKERFSLYNGVPEELSDEDYNNICDICKNGNFLIKNKNKVIILYNNIYMWCVISKKGNVKTIYPLDKNDRNKLKNKTKI